MFSPQFLFGRLIDSRVVKHPLVGDRQEFRVRKLTALVGQFLQGQEEVVPEIAGVAHDIEYYKKYRHTSGQPFDYDFDSVYKAAQ